MYRSAIRDNLSHEWDPDALVDRRASQTPKLEVIVNKLPFMTSRTMNHDPFRQLLGSKYILSVAVKILVRGQCHYRRDTNPGRGEDENRYKKTTSRSFHLRKELKPD